MDKLLNYDLLIMYSGCLREKNDADGQKWRAHDLFTANLLPNNILRTIWPKRMHIFIVVALVEWMTDIKIAVNWWNMKVAMAFIIKFIFTFTNYNLQWFSGYLERHNDWYSFKCN